MVRYLVQGKCMGRSGSEKRYSWGHRVGWSEEHGALDLGGMTWCAMLGVDMT